jgi:hypothetical protein
MLLGSKVTGYRSTSCAYLQEEKEALERTGPSLAWWRAQARWAGRRLDEAGRDESARGSKSAQTP